MGLRSSAFICQRITNAVSFIVQNYGMDVVDDLDFARAETPEKADKSFEILKQVLNDCDLEKSVDKPYPLVSLLGVWIDTEK